MTNGRKNDVPRGPSLGDMARRDWKLWIGLAMLAAALIIYIATYNNPHGVAKTPANDTTNSSAAEK